MVYGRVRRDKLYHKTPACSFKPGKFSFKVLKYLIQWTRDNDWLSTTIHSKLLPVLRINWHGFCSFGFIWLKMWLTFNEQRSLLSCEQVLLSFYNQNSWLSCGSKNIRSLWEKQWLVLSPKYVCSWLLWLRSEWDRAKTPIVWTTL